MNDSFGKLKFLGDSEQHQIWFFKIWMWGTSVIFIVRFLGCCWFLCSYDIGGSLVHSERLVAFLGGGCAIPSLNVKPLTYRIQN